MKKLKVFTILIFISQLFAIYIISKGFLFAADKGVIKDLPTIINQNVKWSSKKVKVIMFIIDALRFDFLHQDEDIAKNQTHVYKNRFKKLYQLVGENPENFVMFATYADPPTVTVHRIQALMTGNLPPFIEITENFGSSAVSLKIEKIFNFRFLRITF